VLRRVGSGPAVYPLFATGPHPRDPGAPHFAHEASLHFPAQVITLAPCLSQSTPSGAASRSARPSPYLGGI
jgi:hypothetical protein